MLVCLIDRGEEREICLAGWLYLCVVNGNIERMQIWIFKGRKNVIIEIPGK